MKLKIDVRGTPVGVVDVACMECEGEVVSVSARYEGLSS